MGNSGNNIVSNCIIEECLSTGIAIWDDCMDNVISGNEIKYCSHGVYFEDGPSGNLLQGNIIIYISLYGIEFRDAPSNSVKYNVINHVDVHGIYIYESDNIVVQRNNIKFNDEGIAIYNSEGLKINFNNFCGNLDHGLGASKVEHLDATYNWWDSKDGPSGIGPGSGDSIFVFESDVSFEPWLKRAARYRNSYNILENRWLFNSVGLRFLDMFPILERILGLLR